MNAYKFFRFMITLAISLALAAPITSIALAEAPPNDDISNATEITSLPFSETYDLAEATLEDIDVCECCWSRLSNTTWYRFSPTEDMFIESRVVNEPMIMSVYTGTPDNLEFVGCQENYYQSMVQFHASAGQSYYFQVAWDGHLPDPNPEPIIGTISLMEIFPPDNDDFDHAKSIGLGFEEWIDLRGATLEIKEPQPSCLEESFLDGSAWYSFTTLEEGRVSFGTNSRPTYPVIAAYEGNSLGELTEIACRTSDSLMTFITESGHTYYFQLALRNHRHGDAYIRLIETPPPNIWNIWHSPDDPSIFEAVNFCPEVSDPGNVGFESWNWDFGDGTLLSATPDYCVSHQYATDGDYTIVLTVTTYDGRSASASKVVPVLTHDVAAVRVAAPKAASVGQTRQITVYIKNNRYPERAQVELFKSIPGGYESVGVTSQNIPVRGGNRTTAVSFSYTFTKADANMGKVTFKAVVTLMDARDALPADNEAISSPPTKVQ